MIEIINFYISGWLKNDRDKILASLTDDCVIIESQGPVYRGKDIITQWIDDWFLRGGKVEKWDITNYYKIDNQTSAFEWVFDCIYENSRHSIEGISLVKFQGDKIKCLREYRTVKPLFDWR